MEDIANIIRQFGPVDLLDIALVAACFFAVLSWLKASLPQTAYQRIILAVPAITLLYILIRLFDLYLLERVFQAFLVVLIIGAVVVFQSDIRRMLDRVISRFSGRQPDEDEGAVDVLTESASKLAASRTGALIAVKGEEPWESHIHGGVRLEGFVSQPLLLGIFQEESPGHDGAVLVEGSRVVRFAAHLPLASDLPQISRFGGTRHAAALGLSQECDALVIAVSEEMGTISIAQDAVLTEDVSASQLKERLDEFWKRQYAPASTASKPWWRRSNVRVALVSVVLSVLLWLLIVYSPYSVVSSFSVPVQFTNLPDDWMINGSVPTQVDVMLAGPAQVFRQLRSEELTMAVDLSTPQEGPLEIAVTEEQLRLPAGVELERAEPAVLTVNLQRTRSIRVPVRVQTTGALPDTLRLDELWTEPDSVSLLVPEESEAPADPVRTTPVDLSRIARDTTIDSRVVPPDGARMTSDSEADVAVHVRVAAAVPE